MAKAKGFFPIIAASAVSAGRRIYSIPMISISMGMYFFYYMIGSVYLIDAVMLDLEFSGVDVGLTIGDVLILIAAASLTLEMGKAADSINSGLTDMVLSIILAMIAWLCLFNLPGFASATWLILTALQTADAIGGSIVAVKSSRRDYGLGPQ